MSRTCPIACQLVDLGYTSHGVLDDDSIVWCTKDASCIPEAPTDFGGEDYVWRFAAPSSEHFESLQREGYLVRNGTPTVGVWLCKRK